MPDSHSQTVKPGALIGSYIVLREIGRGGFGVVYETQPSDPSLKWRVAIKEVKPKQNGVLRAGF